MKCNIQGRAMAASLFGNAIFGLSFMFSRLAMTVATPLQLLSMRFLFAFLLAALVGLFLFAGFYLFQVATLLQ